ncbi:M20/M25/M40 family metallo-hydrolase [Aestuariimicrobium kwangyangense]|uniref:M20/M25/M40 family metallo-hydrolase n=1 Tax=Aestuariimicrobium kwangyangense TaxID=396389 RepID=UPI0003B6BD41|nr:M20/M25/M40 family metallo-hydrolase [Aestuariimicrobium kwangyangense]
MTSRQPSSQTPPVQTENASRRPDAEVVDICRDLITHDTTNYGAGESKGERECAERVAEYLAEVGISSELIETEPRRSTLVAHWEPEGTDSSVPPLLIHCHTDVVPAVAGDWSVDPFAAEVKDDMLWGRGAVDMKDFDAMLLSVVRSRVREGRAPRRPIRMVFFADEEAGGELGSHTLARTRPELFNDCTDAISEVGGFSLTVREDLRLYLVQTAEKGLVWLKLIAEGRAGHGSMRNHENAITELAGALHRIGTHRWPDRLHPAQKAFLAEVEDAFGIEVDNDDVEQTLERLGSISRMIGATMHNTVNPTMIEGGYKANVIPGRAEAQLDGRFIPGFEQELIDTVRELAGPTIQVETTVRRRAVETEFAGGLVEAMRWSLSQEDPHARAVPYLLSAGTDAKGFEGMDINCFGFAPLRLPPELDFTALFHGVDERVPLESLEFGARVLDHFLDRA